MSNIYEKQSVTQTPGVEIGRTGDSVLEFAEREEQKARKTLNLAQEKYRNEVNNSAKISMQEAMENYGNDPEKLSTELSNIRNSIGEGIEDKNVKVDFLSNFDLTSQSYLSQARSNRRKLEREDLRRVTTETLTNADDISALAFSNMLGQDYSPDDFPNYMIADEQKMNMVLAKNDDGTNVYSPEQINRFQEQFAKTKMYATQKYIQTLPPDQQISYAKSILNDTAMVGGKKKLSEMLTGKDWLDLKSEARTIVDRYDKAVKAGKSEKTTDKIAIQVLNKKMFEDRFSEMKGENKDFADVSIGDLFEYRNNLTAEKVRGNIDDKDYEALMLNTTLPIMKMIDEDRENRDYFFFTSPNTRQEAFNYIDRYLQKSNINNPILTANIYGEVYDKLVKEGISLDDTDSDARKKATDIAEKVRLDFVERFVPEISKKDSAKVLLGEDLIDYQNKNTRPASKIKYKLMTDKEGNQYKVFANSDGTFNANSMQLLYKKAEKKQDKKTVDNTKPKVDNVEGKGFFTRFMNLMEGIKDARFK